MLFPHKGWQRRNSEKNSAELTQNGFRYSAEERVHSEAFRGLRKSLFGSSEQKKMAWKKLVLQNILLQQTEKTACFFQDMLQNKIPRVCFYFFLWNGIPSIFLLCRTIWNGIPRVFYSPDGSEWNSESLLLFFFNGTEFRAFFSSAEWFTTEFREFSVPQNSRNSAVLSSAE